jgi:hypothetical protein
LPLISWHEYACKEEKRLADAKRDKFKLRTVIFKKNNPEVVKKHVSKTRRLRKAQRSDPIIALIARKRVNEQKAKSRLEKKLKISE